MEKIFYIKILRLIRLLIIVSTLFAIHSLIYHSISIVIIIIIAKESFHKKKKKKNTILKTKDHFDNFQFSIIKIFLIFVNE